jgi:tetratricopeptide (TPR) repeat protein
MTLERFTEALREEGRLDPERKQALRQRLLARPRRRANALRWVLPLAAVLAGVTAWGSMTRRMVTTETPAPVVPPAPSPIATGSPVAPEPLAAPAVTEAPAAEGAEPLAAPMATEAPAPRPSGQATAGVSRREGPTPVVAPAPPASSDGARLALQAYRDAEHLQFDLKDYAGALDGWERYLRLAGDSPLAVDARYDRGLCLMHLGRKDEARAALAPFAAASPGSYRQAEAQSFLDALR